MAEPLETSARSNNLNSNTIVTIQPTSKLGGRGTPRRKIRRSSNPTVQIARQLENKLKPFRSQFHLQHHPELCDITILYEDGHVEIQKQVHVHSSQLINAHEIDSSENGGPQIYHINDLDSTSCEYLFGNLDSLDRSIPCPPTSHSYTNYLAYQQNPYANDAFESYSNNIEQVYGNINEPSDDDDQEIKTEHSKKRRRRRRKPSKQTTEQEILSLPTTTVASSPSALAQEVNEPENEQISSTKNKRKRRRQRKSNKILPSSSSLDPVDTNASTNLINQHAEQSMSNETIDNSNSNLPTYKTHIPTITVDDIDKTEDDKEKNIAHPVLISQPPSKTNEEIPIRKSSLSRASLPDTRTNLTMSNENLTGIQGDTRKRLSVSFQLDDKDSKTDVHETTQDMNRILNLSNENISSTLGKFLNPDAPDFKPSDSRLSLHSLPAQGHKQRRATHSEVYDKHHSRQRNFSDTYANIDPSTIPSLLSIVPQYIPKHRRSWTATMPTTTASSSQSLTSNSSWWPQEYSNPSSLASSYQSRTAYQMYTPLMEVESSTIEQEPSDDQQQSYPPNRPRALSGRIFPSSSLMSMNTRKRSHSGPEPPLTPPSSHLSGIHSLTRIMVDILRRIKPIIEENKETTNLVANDENLTVNSTSNQQNQSVNQITEPENILNDKQTSSTAMPLSTMSIEQTEGMFDKENIQEFSPSNRIATDESNESTKTTSATIPEPSTEEEKSGNRIRHMVKPSTDEEQQKQPPSSSSSMSALDASKYFQSTSSPQKNLAKKSTETVEEQQMHSPTSLDIKTNVHKNNMRASSMSILGSNIDDVNDNVVDGVKRKNEKEKEDLPITNEDICTITRTDEKNHIEDKEIKPLDFMSSIGDYDRNETKRIDNENYTHTDHYDSPFTIHSSNLPTSSYNNVECLKEKSNNLTRENNTTTSPLTMNQTEQQQQQQPQKQQNPAYVPSKGPVCFSDTSNTSVKPSNITITTRNSNNNEKIQDEQYVEAMLSGDERAAIMTANVDDEGEKHRHREKGEREKREGDVERTLTSTTTTREKEKTEERERAKQPNKNTDSVTSFTSEQHSCPSVVRSCVDDSMANRVSYSSYSKNTTTNNNYPNTSSSNNRSSRSTLTTHTYASTNTFTTEPTYTTTPITGDPRTLHSYYVTSSNYRAPRPSPATSLTRHFHEYEPSYPSISRFRTPSSSSPYRKAHYLDDSDEEIINEEILEITDLNHYPTLMERWGDDTKTVVREEGEFKIEDFVEFEETEPTIIEEILYELVYSGDKLKACRQIDRSRSESRNFRKIKKRRTRRKRQPNDDSSNFSSRDTSGTRSPYYTNQIYSPERHERDRSSTPVQSVLSSSWQSTGFISNNQTSVDIPIRNRFDDNNYVNQIRVNETNPFHSHTQIRQYPQTMPATDDIQYRRYPPQDSIDKRATDLLDEMRQLSNQIGTLISNDDDHTSSVISDDRGITKIQFSRTNQDHKPENLLTEDNRTAIKSSDALLISSNQTPDDKEQSRTNIIDQTSVQEEEISRVQEKEDDEPSSTTDPTAFENVKHEQTADKDTDDDASFSENEPNLSQSFTSDQQEQQQNQFSSSLQKQIQDDHDMSSTTTQFSSSETQDEPNMNQQDLHSFLNELTTHLLPELTSTKDDETDDDRSEASEKTVDVQDNQQKSSAIIDTILPSKELEKQSLVNVVEQTETHQPQISSTQLSFEQKVYEDTENMAEKQSSNVTIQPISLLSSSEGQNELVEDTDKSSYPSKQDNNLSTFIDSAPIVNTSEEKQQQQLSEISSSAIVNHLSTPKSEENLGSNSLVNIVRQIHDNSENTRLSSIHDANQASQLVELAQTNENIPNQPVTINEEDLAKIARRDSTEITTTIETIGEQSDQSSVKPIVTEDKVERNESPSPDIETSVQPTTSTTDNLTNIIQNILTPSQIKQLPSLQSSTIVHTESQVPQTEVEEETPVNQVLINTIQKVLPSSLDEQLSSSTSSADTIVELQPQNQIVSDTVPQSTTVPLPAAKLTTTITTVTEDTNVRSQSPADVSQEEELSFRDKTPEDIADQVSTDAAHQITEKPSIEPLKSAVHEIITTTPTTTVEDTKISEQTEALHQEQPLSASPIQSFREKAPEDVADQVSTDAIIDAVHHILERPATESEHVSTEALKTAVQEIITATSTTTVENTKVSEQTEALQEEEQALASSPIQSFREKTPEDIADQVSTDAIIDAVHHILEKPSTDTEIESVDETESERLSTEALKSAVHEIIAATPTTTLESTSVDSTKVPEQIETPQEEEDEQLAPKSTQSFREKTTEDIVDQLSTHAVVDAVQQILEKSPIHNATETNVEDIDVDLTKVPEQKQALEEDVASSPVKPVREKTPEDIADQVSTDAAHQITEKPSIESLTSAVREIIAARPTTTIDDTTTDLTKVSEQTETPQVEAEQLASPLLKSAPENIADQVSTDAIIDAVHHILEKPSTDSEKETVDETESERISTEALKSAVQEIIAATSSAIAESTAVDSTTESEKTELPQVEEQLASVPVQSLREKTPENIADQVSTDAIVDAVHHILEKPSTDSEKEAVDEVESERLSTEALKSAVHEIIAATSTTAIEGTTADLTKVSEQTEALQQEQALTSSPVQSLREKTPEDMADQVSTDAIIDAVQHILENQSTDTEKESGDETESERLSIESLTTAVGEIIAATATTIAEETTVDSTKVSEQKDVSQVEEQPRAVSPADVTDQVSSDSEKETVEKVESEVLPTEALKTAVDEIITATSTTTFESTAVDSTKVAKQTEIPQEEQPLASLPVHALREKTPEDIADQVSIDAIVDAVHHILEKPSTDSEKESADESESERVSTEALKSAVHEIISATPTTTVDGTVVDSTKVAEQTESSPVEDQIASTSEDIEKEAEDKVESERLSIEALKTAFHETITATSTTSIVPTESPLNQSIVEDVSITTTALSVADKTADSTKLPEEVETSQEKEEELSSSLVQSTEEQIAEDVVDRVSTDVIIEGVHQIGQKPSTEELSKDEHEVIEAPVSVETTTSEVTVDNEKIEAEVERLATETLTNALREIIEAPIPTESTSSELSMENDKIEAEAERLATETLTKSVRDIIEAPASLEDELFTPVDIPNEEVSNEDQSDTKLVATTVVKETPSESESIVTEGHDENKVPSVEIASEAIPEENLLSNDLSNTFTEITNTPSAFPLSTSEKTVDKSFEDSTMTTSTDSLSPSTSKAETPSVETESKKEIIIEQHTFPNLTESVRKVLPSTQIYQLPSLISLNETDSDKPAVQSIATDLQKTATSEQQLPLSDQKDEDSLQSSETSIVTDDIERTTTTSESTDQVVPEVKHDEQKETLQSSPVTEKKTDELFESSETPLAAEIVQTSNKEPQEIVTEKHDKLSESTDIPIVPETIKHEITATIEDKPNVIPIQNLEDIVQKVLTSNDIEKLPSLISESAPVIQKDVQQEAHKSEDVEEKQTTVVGQTEDQSLSSTSATSTIEPVEQKLPSIEYLQEILQKASTSSAPTEETPIATADDKTTTNPENQTNIIQNVVSTNQKEDDSTTQINIPETISTLPITEISPTAFDDESVQINRQLSSDSVTETSISSEQSVSSLIIQEVPSNEQQSPITTSVFIPITEDTTTTTNTTFIEHTHDNNQQLSDDKSTKIPEQTEPLQQEQPLASSPIQSAQEKTPDAIIDGVQLQEPSTDSELDTVDEVESERLSTEALKTAVHEIIAATPTTTDAGTTGDLTKVSEQKETTQIEEEQLASSPVQSSREKTPADAADQVSTDAIIDAVHHILENPSTDTEKESDDETESERLSTESLTTAVHEIIAARPTTTIDDTTTDLTKVSEQTETPQVEAEQLASPLLKSAPENIADQVSTDAIIDAVHHILEKRSTDSEKETVDETESERISTEALKSAVQEIIAATSSAIAESTAVDSTTESEKTELPQVEEQLASVPVQSLREKTPENIADQVSADAIVDAVHQILEKPSGDSEKEAVDEVESERLSTEALKTAVREIITVTPTAIVADTIADVTKVPEQTDALQQEQSLASSSEQSAREKTPEDVADQVSTDAIIDAVHHILEKPSTDSEKETVDEAESERISTEALKSAVQEIIAATPTTTVEDTNVSKQPLASSRVQSFREKTPEDVADQVLTDAIVDAVHDILQKPSSDNEIESVDESESERFSTEALKPAVHEIIAATPTTTVEGIAEDSTNIFEQIEASHEEEQPVAASPVQSIQEEILKDVADQVSTDSEKIDKISFEKETTVSTTEKQSDESPQDSDEQSISSSLYTVVDAVNVVDEPTAEKTDSEYPVSPSPQAEDDTIAVSELTSIVGSVLNPVSIKTTDSPVLITQTSKQRASAVTPTVQISDVSTDHHDDNELNSAATFFVPSPSMSVDPNFQELYSKRHFVTPTAEEPELEFSAVSRQESLQSTTPSESSKKLRQSPLAYYELQEQRHTLMSPQQSPTDGKQEKETSSLTTWATAPLGIDFDATSNKQEQSESDIILDDQAYEAAKNFDLSSPSAISNLPIKDYHQVFGVPAEIINTVDDITEEVTRRLSEESENETQSTSVSDSVKKITDALDALESDLTQPDHNLNHEINTRYNVLLSHIDSLEQPLIDAQNTSVSSETENEVNVEHLTQAMEQILATPFQTVTNEYEKLAQSEPSTHSSLETVLEQMLASAHFPTIFTKLTGPTDTTTTSSSDEQKDSTSILDKATSVATDIMSSITHALHMDNEKEQPQEISSPVSGHFTSNDVYHGYKQLIEPTIEEKHTTSLIDKASSMISGIITSATLVESDDADDDDNAELPSTSDLLETMKNLIPSSLRTIESEVVSSISGYFTSNDVYHGYKQPVVPVTEDLQTASTSDGIVDKAKSLISGLVSTVTHILPTTTETEDVTDEYSLEKDSLIETSKEILATPLQSAIDTYEQITSTSQDLQVEGDNYPWYSNYYTISDADAYLSDLYNRLSHTMEQLDQRPTPTTVEFQPEPHENLTTPNYDRQALEDTQDTRDKVHELAQLSRAFTSNTSTDSELLPSLTKDEVKQIDDAKNDSTSSDASQLLSSTSIIHSDENKVEDLELVEQAESRPTSASKKKKKPKQKTTEVLPAEPVVEPPPPPSPVISKTVTTTIHSKTVTQMKPESEGEEDNDGFQVVSYRKHTPVVAVEPPKPPVKTSKKTTTTEPKSKPKQDKKQLPKLDISLSSPSTDTDTTSSSKVIQQKSTEETSSSITSVSVPQQPAVSTLRLKAFTSPDDEEDDNEGFQLVQHRKRISSAPRLDKASLPPLPTKPSNRQNFNRGTSQRLGNTHGRHGSETRSMPRSTASRQTPSNRGRPPMSPQTSPRSAHLRDTPPMSSSDSENKYTTPIKQQESRQADYSTILSTFPSQSSEQKETVQTEPEPLATTVAPSIDQSFQQTTVKEILPVAVISTTKKAPLTEEEDEDGFRVVRYRKTTPSSPPVRSKHQSASPSIPTGTSQAKKRPPRPKKSKEESTVLRPPRPIEILSSSTEDFKNQTNLEQTSTPRSENEPQQSEEHTTSADTSTDSSKKPKRKHKRSTRDLVGSELSTPSDEIPNVSETTTSQPLIVEETSEKTVEDEDLKATASKKPAKKRKKKPQVDEQNILNSSSTSATDKETASNKPSSAQTVDEQEYEWRIAQSRKKKSKSSGSGTSSQSDSPSKSLQTKGFPQKITDVKFEFKKDGQLTITSQSPLEQSPAEWGTVKIDSEQADSLPVEKIISETKTESSETSGEGDLNAYRDESGRLRRKKPRKTQTSSVVKTDEEILETPVSNIVDEQIEQLSDLIREKSSIDEEDTSQASSKLDAFLPNYIREQIEKTSPPRSIPMQSTSADTSENESRNQIRDSPDPELFSRENSDLQSTANQTESDTVQSSSTTSTDTTTRKKKQRPKMLKKDVEATLLLTNEFDETPLTITEIRQASPVKQSTDDESLLSSNRDHFSSAVSHVSDSFASARSSQTTIASSGEQTDEPVPSSNETLTATTTTVTTRKSTRSPRKRSKRDSGPDYDNLSLQSTSDLESTTVDQSRQRTLSGRQIINTEEENEQQAILADDEEDEDPHSKPVSTSDNQQSSSANSQISGEPLRSVQGFHSYTPNKYQYNQYEEGPQSVTTQTKPTDEVLARGFDLWLNKEKDNQETSGLTRAMQSLIIQPVESENEDEDEEDSWNGPRAKKPTYTTGVPIEKRIHENSGYNINHPRTTIKQESALIRTQSDDQSYQDDPSSKLDDDDDDNEEENSLDDTSDKQQSSSTIDERQTHSKNLTDLNQPQTNFTEDDVQRCLGEDFYRESLAVNTRATEQRTLTTSLGELVVKPAQLLDDLDDDNDESDKTTTTSLSKNQNNNNNAQSVHFDEWAHFLERQSDQDSFFTAASTSSPTIHSLSTSPECSYARIIDDETVLTDVNRTNLTDYVQHLYENDQQRYGDFTLLDETSPEPENTNEPLRTTNQIEQNRPSQNFQRWRNQTNRERDNQNTIDDEIVISHSNSGLSRRVRPSS